MPQGLGVQVPPPAPMQIWPSPKRYVLLFGFGRPSKAIAGLRPNLFKEKAFSKKVFSLIFLFQKDAGNINVGGTE